MSTETLTRTDTPRTGSPLVRTVHPVRALLVWATLAAVAGALIGLSIEVLIAVLTDRPFDPWFISQSVLFAEAVGVSALVASRYAFPLFESLQPVVRYGLVFLTLVGSAMTVTALSLRLRPGVVFSRPASFLALVGANTVLAVVVGGALVMWENMKRSLARAYDELRRKEAMEREMALAREVQLGLLPRSPPLIDGYQVAFRFRTAAQVGGDMLDFIRLPGGRVGVSVGDVSGKGIAAALLMANVQALVRTIAELEGDPGRVCSILSDGVARNAAGGRYVTFAYVVLDPQTGVLRYSLGGHHPPVIVGPHGVRFLESGGLPLGMFAGGAFPAGHDVLAPGESMLVYTDGLVEAPAPGPAQDEFGRARVLEIAREVHAAGADALADRILAALDGHIGPGAAGADDTTLVVIHRPTSASPVVRA